MSNKISKETILSMLNDCEERHGKVTTKVFNDDDEFCHSSTVKSRFGTFSNAKLAADLEDVGQIHLTNEKMTQINNSITDRQREILKGILMGDAWIDKEKGKTACMSVEMVNKEFLEWVNCELGDIVSDLRMRAEAEELAEKNLEYGYTVDEDNYNDIWVMKTRSLEYFDTLREWYDSGQKRFPRNLELSPIIVKVWYCCDGSFVGDSYPVIYAANEEDKRDEILKMFKDIPLNPSFTDGGGGTIQFSSLEVEEFFEYIGKPLPGFEYKWPEEFK